MDASREDAPSQSENIRLNYMVPESRPVAAPSFRGVIMHTTTKTSPLALWPGTGGRTRTGDTRRTQVTRALRHFTDRCSTN